MSKESLNIGKQTDLSIFTSTMVEMTWAEVKKSAEDGDVVLFPVGVIEEHGPNEDDYKLIRTIKKDTTGDEISDVVKVFADVKNKGYVVEIDHHTGKAYILKPAREFKYLAAYTTFWNINIQIVDINNDTVPEIITWGQMTLDNAIHIFRWNGSEYKIL